MLNNSYLTLTTFFLVIKLYYLTTVLDDYSRYIVSWELVVVISKDAEQTIENALQCTGLKNNHPPKLLSDNGSCYISNNLAIYLDSVGMDHVRGAPNNTKLKWVKKHHVPGSGLLVRSFYHEPCVDRCHKYWWKRFSGSRHDGIFGLPERVQESQYFELPQRLV